MNDGSPTHFSKHNRFSHIDLTLCLPYLTLAGQWRTLENLHGSDHYPILVVLFHEKGKESIRLRPRYSTDSADWITFKDKLKELSSERPVSGEVNKDAANITKIFHQAAHISIPQNHTIGRDTMVE